MNVYEHKNMQPMQAWQRMRSRGKLIKAHIAASVRLVCHSNLMSASNKASRVKIHFPDVQFFVAFEDVSLVCQKIWHAKRFSKIESHSLNL